MTRIMRELGGVGECIRSSGQIGWYIGMLIRIKRSERRRRRRRRRRREVAML